MTNMLRANNFCNQAICRENANSDNGHDICQQRSFGATYQVYYCPFCHFCILPTFRTH